MIRGFTKNYLNSKLTGKTLPGQTIKKTQQYINDTSGQKISTGKVKGKIVDLLKYKSELARKERYDDIGLNYSEKKRLEKMIVGGKTRQQLRDEEKRAEKLKNLHIVETRVQRSREEDSVADQIKARRKSREEIKQELKQSRVDNALVVNEGEGKVQVGADQLGLSLERERRKESKVTALNPGLGIPSRGISTAANSGSVAKESGEISTGFGTVKNSGRVRKREGNVLHGNFSGNTRASGSAPTGRDKPIPLARTGTNG